MKTVILVALISLCLFAQSNFAQTTEVSYSFGAVFGGPISGSPTIINPKFIASNLYDKYNVQLMATYDFNQRFLAEFDINYTIFSNESISHSAGIGGGIHNDSFLLTTKKNFLGMWTSGGEIFESKYAKINYSLMWKWFFLQTGFAIGSKHYSDGILTLQLGYMYRF